MKNYVRRVLMTIWDFLDKTMGGWPPIAGLFLIAALAAVIIFIIGYTKHGMDFVKHGFKQTNLDASIESRFDIFEKRFDNLEQSISDLRTEVKSEINGLRTEVKGEISDLRTEVKGEINGLRTEVKGEINDLRTELDTIKVNHFGHLKNYLSILNGILLDKEIISNQEKARLDNELRGM
jgi:hypothetical protein